MNEKIGYKIILILILILISCNDPNLTEQKKENGFLVEAKFTKNGQIDGLARYYIEQKLHSEVNFENGVRKGLALNYYENGLTKDSFFYRDDKPSGYWYHFDSLGRIDYIDYYYYGLLVGPQYFYRSGKLLKFAFADFNLITIAECKYDSSEMIQEVGVFKMNLTLKNAYVDNKTVKKVFAFLPRFPNADIKYSIGVANELKADKELFVIGKEKMFIDTILPNPEKGWHYFISCQVRANNGAVDKVFIEDVMTN